MPFAQYHNNYRLRSKIGVSLPSTKPLLLLKNQRFPTSPFFSFAACFTSQSLPLSTPCTPLLTRATLSQAPLTSRCSMQPTSVGPTWTITSPTSPCHSYRSFSAACIASDGTLHFPHRSSKFSGV